MQSEQTVPVVLATPTTFAKIGNAIHRGFSALTNSVKLPITIIFFCAISSLITYLYFKQVSSSEIITAKTQQIETLQQQITQLQTENKSLIKSSILPLEHGNLTEVEDEK